jgi:hypothetical protein
MRGSGERGARDRSENGELRPGNVGLLARALLRRESRLTRNDGLEADRRNELRLSGNKLYAHRSGISPPNFTIEPRILRVRPH